MSENASVQPVLPGIIDVGGQPHMRDAKGRLVPVELVKPADKLEDEMVRKVMAFALDLSAQIARFKEHTFADLNGFQQLLEQDYGARAGGEKGNVTFQTVDGLMQVKVQIANLIEFGPQLQQAKALIDECLLEWVLGTRRRSVGQLPMTVAAASDEDEHVRHADFLREWLEDGVLELALFDILDAIGKGFSVTEIEWESTPEAVLPKGLDHRPQRWFEFDQVDGETVVLAEGVTREPLSPHKFIVHRHKAKSGLTIRSGLARVASWAWMYKAFTAKDWALFTQNYGMPTRVGKFDRAASDKDKEVLWRAVANIAGDCAAIIPKEMEIDFVSVEKGTGSPGQLYERRADWYDRQISKLVLGQTTTTDAVSGGHAVAQEHRLVQEDLERADAKLLSASLTKQLIQLIIALNFGPQAKYPRLHIGRPDEVPLKDVVNAIDKLGPQGLTIEASELRDRLGFSDPAKPRKDGKAPELIGGRAPRPAPALPRLSAPLQQAPGKPAGLEQMRHLVSRHASAPEPEFVDRLSERLAEDAAGALAGLTGAVKEAFDKATDMADLADMLARLELDPAELADAMGRAIALSHLTGRAALLDDIVSERDDRRD